MKRILLLLALCAAWGLRAQTAVGIDTPAPLREPAAGAAWTLDDCIAYALQNNIDVRQRSLQVEQRDVELSTARWSRLPSVNAAPGEEGFVSWLFIFSRCGRRGPYPRLSPLR